MVVTRSKRKREELALAAGKRSSGSGFRHKPLNYPHLQIRLLKILPGDSDDTIRLESEVFNLVDGPSYNAISYTWGSKRSSQVVYVDDEPFKARNDCHHALWQVRLHFPGEWIWIDSICINQHDEDEKSHQVQMMFNIYSSADLVLSCVGPHADNSEIVAEAAQEILELILEFEQPEAYPTAFDRMKWASSRGKGFCVSLWRSWFKFSQRPYWSRLWIIQEIGASGVETARRLRILCGRDSLDALALEALNDFGLMHVKEIVETQMWGQVVLSEQSKMKGTGFASLIRILESDGIPAENYISKVKSFGCSDPRDRVYGMLSLLDWPNGFEAIKPDYSKSAWDILLAMAPLLPPPQIVAALQALNTGISEADLRILAGQRAYIDGLRPQINSCLSNAAQCRGSKASQRRPIKLRTGTPLAIEVRTLHLGPLSPDLLGLVASQMDEAIEDFFDVECERFEMVPYLPIGLFAGANPLMLVDRRARTGDLILDLDGYLFVLRHRYGQVYDVIGSAIWNQKTECNDLASRYKELASTYGTRQGSFYVEAEFNLSLEDQMVFAGVCSRDKSNNLRKRQLEFLYFLIRLVKKPKGAVSLKVKPYDVKTDIDEKGAEWLCFEEHEKCDRHFCRNRRAE